MSQDGEGSNHAGKGKEIQEYEETREKEISMACEEIIDITPKMSAEPRVL